MGRPLNKKFFGNRNIGRNGREGTTGRSHYSQGEGTMHSVPAGDDGIGGEGLANVVFGASVADTSYGSGAYLNKMPHITTIQKPTLPGGVQAVADVTHVQAVHAVQHARGTGYQIGDVIEGTTGTGLKARFKVTKLRVLSVTLGSLPASSAFDGGENLVWDAGVNSHWTIPTIITNVASTGTPDYDLAGTYSSFAGGVWSGGQNYDPAPTTALTITGGNMTPNPTNPSYNTRGTGDLLGKVDGDAVDNNGAGGTATFTYGIEEVVVLSGLQGDYTAVDAAAQAVTNLTVGSTGANATLDIFYGVKTITVTEKGSGYIGTETVTFTDPDAGLSETRANGTIVLTQDTGLVGSATNQENAIIARVYYDGEVQIADIIKQQSARSYVVIVQSDPADPEYTDKDDEPVLAKLVNHVPVDNAPPDAEYAPVKEMTIRATDDNGNTYFVTKLTAHKARLWRDTNNESEWLFANGESARWTFGNAQAGERKSVQIENA